MTIFMSLARLHVADAVADADVVIGRIPCNNNHHKWVN